MRPELVEQALEHISDKYIQEAAVKRRHPIRWAGVIAAVLALVLTLHMIGFPKLPGNSAENALESPSVQDAVQEESFSGISKLSEIIVAARSKPRVMSYPKMEAYGDNEDFLADADRWRTEDALRQAVTADALDAISPFFKDSSTIFLRSEDGSNKVWSPVNGYIALAMLAEVTGGSSSAQILDVLGTEDTFQLRQQVSAVWESIYFDDGNNICIPANSLWLDEDVEFCDDIPTSLAYSYYASTYQTDLGSSDATVAMRTWLNENTGGLLRKYADNLTLDPQTVMALVSTVYMQSKWLEEFNEALNTIDTFHAPGGDTECIFMNRDSWTTQYFWDDSYGAVSLNLRDGSQMWLFLPDEELPIQDILEEGRYLETIRVSNGETYSNSKFINVNLSVPKFDVSSSADLISGLQEMGITDVFDWEVSDFSPLIASEIPVYLAAVEQAARVSIDEEGAAAASYILMPEAMGAEPPEDTIDFVLDRPFLFVVEKDGLPLFTGVVNQP